MFGKKKKSFQHLTSNLPANINVGSSKEATETVDIYPIEKDGRNGIGGFFRNSLDLLQLHMLASQYIQENIDAEQKTLRSELTDLTQFVADRKGTYLERTEVRERIATIEERLANVSEEIHAYHKEIEPTLKQYQNVPKTNMNAKKLEDPVFREVYNLIQTFIQVCEQFIPMDINLVFTSNTSCACASPPKMYITIGEGTKVCPVCHMEIDVFDSNRASATPKTSYDDWGNMQKAIAAFQGTKAWSIPDDLEERLDRYFSTKGILTGEEVREMEPNEYGKKPRTTRTLMAEALVAIDYKSLIDDIQAVMAYYWGWQLPDLSRYMEEFQHLYDISRPYYQAFKGERKSALGAPFQLMQILFHMGFDVDIGDFKLVMTPDLQADYNTIWERVAKPLKWKWIPL